MRKDKGIPVNWTTKASKKNGGVIYQKPGNPHTDIRVMPGNPNSPYPHSQKPYVKIKKDGSWLDKNGNKLSDDRSPDAHIPLDQFRFPL